MTPDQLAKIGMDITTDVRILKRLLGHHTLSGVRACLQRIQENAEKITQGLDKDDESVVG